jgi:hypothetical protein
MSVMSSRVRDGDSRRTDVDCQVSASDGKQGTDHLGLEVASEDRVTLFARIDVQGLRISVRPCFGPQKTRRPTTKSSCRLVIAIERIVTIGILRSNVVETCPSFEVVMTK